MQPEWSILYVETYHVPMIVVLITILKSTVYSFSVGALCATRQLFMPLAFVCGGEHQSGGPLI